MGVAVIGWCSLIWEPKDLPLQSKWHANGPVLPLEFARLSNDGCVTLVVHPGEPPQPTYWALSSCDDWEQAREDLQKRERCPDIQSIHVLTSQGKFHGKDRCAEIMESVSTWLTSKPQINAALWTGLGEGNNWHKRLKQKFAPNLAFSYLSSLEGEEMARARRYIIKAPSRIRTELRKRIEAELGWQAEETDEASFCEADSSGWSDFSEYARHHDDWYSLLDGIEVTLRNGEAGKIDGVYQPYDDSENPVFGIRIRFPDKSSRTLESPTWSAFENHLTFPPSVNLDEAALKDERRRIKQERTQQDDDEHQAELQREREGFSDVARAHEASFRETGDGWILARASGLWRRAGLPQEALRVTSQVENFSGNPKGALLTTRGAAFADLDQWARALECARKAIACSRKPTFHPYMLLARVYAQAGDEEQLQLALEKARSLGATEEQTRRTVRGWIDAVPDPMSRKRIVQALLKVNPILFEDLRKKYLTNGNE